VRRTKLVPAVVLILGVAAIGTTTLLDRHAAASRSAGLRLATLKTNLITLQGAPFAATPSTGGSPAQAAQTMRVLKQEIADTLVRLDRTSPPESLRRVPA
jgi:hypothetical protein